MLLNLNLMRRAAVAGAAAMLVMQPTACGAIVLARYPPPVTMHHTMVTMASTGRTQRSRDTRRQAATFDTVR